MTGGSQSSSKNSLEWSQKCYASAFRRYRDLVYSSLVPIHMIKERVLYLLNEHFFASRTEEYTYMRDVSSAFCCIVDMEQANRIYQTTETSTQPHCTVLRPQDGRRRLSIENRGGLPTPSIPNRGAAYVAQVARARFADLVRHLSPPRW